MALCWQKAERDGSSWEIERQSVRITFLFKKKWKIRIVYNGGLVDGMERVGGIFSTRKWVWVQVAKGKIVPRIATATAGGPTTWSELGKTKPTTTASCSKNWRQKDTQLPSKFCNDGRNWQLLWIKINLRCNKEEVWPSILNPGEKRIAACHGV